LKSTNVLRFESIRRGSKCDPTSKARSHLVYDIRDFVGAGNNLGRADRRVETNRLDGRKFWVNDRQYVEVSPTLKGEEDRLIQIGFETSDARKP
jgi:hypothetical protein